MIGIHKIGRMLETIPTLDLLKGAWVIRSQPTSLISTFIPVRYFYSSERWLLARSDVLKYVLCVFYGLKQNYAGVLLFSSAFPDINILQRSELREKVEDFLRGR